MKRQSILERIDALARELADLRAEVAHELGLDGDDEVAQLAAADLQRARRRSASRARATSEASPAARAARVDIGGRR